MGDVSQTKTCPLCAETHQGGGEGVSLLPGPTEPDSLFGASNLSAGLRVRDDGGSGLGVLLGV